MDTYKLLKKLTETHSPSGYEHRISGLLSELWKPYTDSVTTDRLGSVFATRSGSGKEPRPQLMLAAHVDEIGLMVTEVVDHNGYGFLYVTNVGGVDIRLLYAQCVVVHGRRDLFGVLSSLPASMLPAERRSQAYGFEDLVVDTALPAATLRELVDVGDFISFQQPLRKLNGQERNRKGD